MLQDFKNKKIAFIGDSILEHGHYTYYIRSFLHQRKDNVIIYNGGIGGMCASLVTEKCLYADALYYSPDYCMFSYGVNDLGIWFYDSYLEQDEKVAQGINELNEQYFNGVKNIVNMLKAKGVKPILLSPMPVNELLVEKPDIPTLADNKDKGELIKPWFYKRKTFVEINKGLEKYNDFLRELALENDLIFFDVFDKLKKLSFTEQGMFGQDGIHYTEHGAKFIAKCILECIGYDEVTIDFGADAENDKIKKIENQDRGISFITYARLASPEYDELTQEQKIEKIKETYIDPNTPVWLKNNCQNYLNNITDFYAPKKLYKELVEKYLTK